MLTLFVIGIVAVGAFASVVAESTDSQTFQAVAVPIDTGGSRLIVKAFKSGLFSGFAHDHEIAAPIREGIIDAQGGRVHLEFDVQQMRVLDPQLEPDKRAEVQTTMLSEKVLDAARYSTIRFVSRTVQKLTDGTYRVEGELTLHGVTRPLVIPVRMDGEKYVGTTKFAQTQFGIKPVSVAGGTVKVKDVVEITFEVMTKRPTVASKH